jgi:hypothetical protein
MVGLRAEGATTAGPPSVIRGRGRRRRRYGPAFPSQQPPGSWGGCILGRNRTTKSLDHGNHRLWFLPATHEICLSQIVIAKTTLSPGGFPDYDSSPIATGACPEAEAAVPVEITHLGILTNVTNCSEVSQSGFPCPIPKRTAPGAGRPKAYNHAHR